MAKGKDATALAGLVERLEAEMRSVLGGIAGDIAALKTEIADIRSSDLADERIPEAGSELAAVVEMTEQASNDIMAAAEAIMCSEADTLEDYRAAVEGEVMKIFEACAFQDITGQRISKVVETLTLIEQRIRDYGPDMAETNRREDRDLLNGPALPGEGLEQNAIDALLDTAA